MYRRDGQAMPEREEGAAFFHPIGFDGSEVPPRVMGLQPGMLTQGFVPSVHEAVGDDAAPSGGGTITDALESPAWRILSMAGAALGAFHGYKRNDSIGWAIGWGLLGSIAPIIVIPIAFAQGFGKRKR